jgi:molybdenum cofactor guanylyltransferase
LSASSPPPLVGIFVGGASSRMGGRPKGLLRAPDGESIVQRWRSLAKAVGLPSVLVGSAGAYTHLGIETVDDDLAGAGPLGGLVGLLKSRPEIQVVAVACDMPYVTADLLKRLAFCPLDAPVIAPWRDGRYEPLLARYERARVLPFAERQLVGGDRSLQKLLRDAGAQGLPMSEDEWPLLADWDEPPSAAG